MDLKKGKFRPKIDYATQKKKALVMSNELNDAAETGDAPEGDVRPARARDRRRRRTRTTGRRSAAPLQTVDQSTQIPTRHGPARNPRRFLNSSTH